MKAKVTVIRGKPIIPQIEISDAEVIECLKPVLSILDHKRLKEDIDYLRGRRELIPEGKHRRITFSAIARRAGCSRHNLRRWYNDLNQPRNPSSLVRIRLWVEKVKQLESSAQKEVL